MACASVVKAIINNRYGLFPLLRSRVRFWFVCAVKTLKKSLYVILAEPTMATDGSAAGQRALVRPSLDCCRAHSQHLHRALGADPFRHFFVKIGLRNNATYIKSSELNRPAATRPIVQMPIFFSKYCCECCTGMARRAIRISAYRRKNNDQSISCPKLD